MVSRQVGTRVLGVRILPNADPALREHLDVRPGDRSLGILRQTVMMCHMRRWMRRLKGGCVRGLRKSMYAGAANASTALAGEFIDFIRAGSGGGAQRFDAAFAYIENEAHFIRPMRTAPWYTSPTAFHR